MCHDMSNRLIPGIILFNAIVCYHILSYRIMSASAVVATLAAAVRARHCQPQRHGTYRFSALALRNPEKDTYEYDLPSLLE